MVNIEISSLKMTRFAVWKMKLVVSTLSTDNRLGEDKANEDWMGDRCAFVR